MVARHCRILRRQKQTVRSWRMRKSHVRLLGVSQGGELMINQAMISSVSLSSRVIMLAGAMVSLTGVLPAGAGAPVPWECSNYTDEAQTRCLNAFIERQQEQIGQLEGRLESQQEMVGQLKGQLDRQNAAAT